MRHPVNLTPGESITIYGAGPVGLIAADSAMIKGASQVFIVDTHPDRLALAGKWGQPRLIQWVTRWCNVILS